MHLPSTLSRSLVAGRQSRILYCIHEVPDTKRILGSEAARKLWKYVAKEVENTRQTSVLLLPFSSLSLSLSLSLSQVSCFQFRLDKPALPLTPQSLAVPKL